MTTPYSQLTHEQLVSAITERDKQLKVAFSLSSEHHQTATMFMNQVNKLQDQLRVVCGEVEKCHSSCAVMRKVVDVVP